MDVALLRVPFFLEPDYDDKTEVSNRKRLEEKWGGPAGFAVQKKRHRLKERGAEVGCVFDLDRPASYTLKSHKLVQWISRTRGLKTTERFYDELNKRHFVQSKKLNDREMLSEAASIVGVSEEDVDAALASDDDIVLKAYEACHRLGINSIPTFIFDSSKIVNGAAHADDFAAALHDIHRDAQSTTTAKKPVFADILGIAEDVYTGNDAVFTPTQLYQSI